MYPATGLNPVAPGISDLESPFEEHASSSPPSITV
jgi:hypothetical protein